MQRTKLNQALAGALLAITMGYAQLGAAHEGSAVMDSEGIAPNFTGYAIVTCENEGDTPTDHLFATITDLSPPVPNLLVNLQIIKGDLAVSTTDPISGDANPGPEARLHGGNGVYLVLVNKTNAGARAFKLSYHCQTAAGIHTPTSAGLKQFK